MRMRKKPWTNEVLATSPRLVCEPEEKRGKWQTYFGGAYPLHVELGCGKGRFITESANREPNVRFIGVERQPDVLATAIRRAETAATEASPVFLQRDVDALADCFAPGEIERLYINFCDPWPNKKKWAKRRLTHVRYLAIYARLLVRDGAIFLKTDNRQLFEFSINQFSECGYVMRNVSLNLHQSGYTENICTEYEEKFSAAGMPIYRVEAYNVHR